MPICPFATQLVLNGPTGSYQRAPFRIVHHTTQGRTAEGAFGAFRRNNTDPHFTVDDKDIYQHIDTIQFAKSLSHPKGTPHTNRLCALQIEVVGYAEYPRIKSTLDNVARLCRWLEATHDVPRIWPNGYPKPPVIKEDGKPHDPNNHNRDVQTWLNEAGHYGHSQVPYNTHWDPGYTNNEVRRIMGKNILMIDPIIDVPDLTDPNQILYFHDHDDDEHALIPIDEQDDPEEIVEDPLE